MATKLVQYIVFVMALLEVIRSQPTKSIDSRVYTIERLLSDILTRDMEEIKNELKNLNIRECGDSCQTIRKDYSQTPTLLKMVEDVNKKSRAMSKAFSWEKKELRELKQFLFEALDGMNVSLDIDRDQIASLFSQVTTLTKLADETNLERGTITRLIQQVAGLESQITLLLPLETLSGEMERDRETIEALTKQNALLEERVFDLERKVTHQQIDQWMGESRPEMTKRVDFDQTTARTTPPSPVNQSTSSTNDACPKGSSWIRKGHSCILYPKGKKTWINAKKSCKEMGGILAEPNSREAMSHIIDGLPVKLKRWWIGARDVREEGVFVWESTERPIGDLVWNDGEPSDTIGQENCVELIADTVLNDNICGKRARFICEIKL